MPVVIKYFGKICDILYTTRLIVKIQNPQKTTRSFLPGPYYACAPEKGLSREKLPLGILG